MKKTIGVIGLGSIGMRHTRNLKTSGHTVLGYDPNIDNIPHPLIIRSSIEEIIEAADAIVIASPTPLHAEHLAAVNMSGLPIFVEKPVAHTLNVPTGNIKMVGYNLRFHPCVKQAKEWIDSGDIGELVWGNFTLGQHSAKPPYLRDGVILNWSHEIDLALHLLGFAQLKVSSTVITDDAINSHDVLTDITLDHGSCQSVVHLDYITKPEVRQSIIVGTGGQVIIDLVSHNAWLRDSDGEILRNLQGSKDSWDRTYIDEMKEFLGYETWDDGSKLGCTAKEGMDVLKICLQVREQAGLP